MMAEPILDIHFYLSCPPPLGKVDAVDPRIEEVDPIQFLEQSLSSGSPVCCTLQGALGVSLDGVPWNGDFDRFTADGPLVPYYFVNAIYCYVDWLVAAIAMLRGATTYECAVHDDEGPVRFFRSRRDEIYFTWREIEPELRRVPLEPFAALLLREGKKLFQFSEAMLSDLRLRMQVQDLPKKTMRALQDRVREIEGWNLKQHTADLEAACALTAAPPTVERLWQDVVDLLQDYPPAFADSVGLLKDKPIRLVTLRWDDLPEGERMYIEAFAQAAGTQPVSWQNPFGKGKWKHYLERSELADGVVTLVLRTARGR